MMKVVLDAVRRFCITSHRAIVLLEYRMDASITIYFADTDMTCERLAVTIYSSISDPEPMECQSDHCPKVGE